MIFDQGSKPSHKASIIDLYEQGIDMARFTNLTIEAVGRNMKSYKNEKLLMEKGFNLLVIMRVSGMGRSTVIQNRELVENYPPELRKES